MKTFDINDFAAWLKTQSGSYTYHLGNECAMAQYAKATWGAEGFKTVDPHRAGEGAIIYRGEDHILYPYFLEEALLERPYTFEDLSQRVDDLLLEHCNDNVA